MEPPTQRYSGKPAAARLEERRAQLVDAAVELFGTRGYREPSIEEICTVAGVSKRYFYESFDTREDLLLAAYEACNAELGEVLTARVSVAVADGIDPRRLAAAAVGGVLDFIDQDRRRGRIVFIEILGASPRVEERYLESVENWVQFLAALVPADRDWSVRPELLIRATLGTVIGLVIEWLQSGRDVSTNDLLASIMALYSGELFRLPD